MYAIQGTLAPPGHPIPPFVSKGLYMYVVYVCISYMAYGIATLLFYRRQYL
jgi:hypothetical protein